MRLLYVIDSLAPGGAEMSLAEMAPELVSNGVELHVLPLGRRNDLKERLQEAGAIVHDGPQQVSRPRFVGRVAHVIASVRPDLVHTTLYEANVAGRIAARLRRVPSSSSFVGDTYGRTPHGRVAGFKRTAARLVDLSTARFASRFHAVSQHLAAAAVTHLGVPREQIDVIPRGRDKQRFPFRPEGIREQVRRQLGLRDDDRVVVAVGRLERVKGLIHLMDALPQLEMSVPGVKVLVAGKDGAAGEEIRAAASHSNIPVTFLGHRKDVGRLLAGADVLAFPSLSEGSPGTLIEAMATGCPIVASAIPPNLEVLGIGDHSVGVTVGMGDSGALARGLDSILNQSVDAGSMTSMARRRFEEYYEIASVSSRMVQFFERAAGEFAAPTRGRR